VREDGVAVRVVEAPPGRETLEALRKELHRLLVEEKVAPWDLAVLSGTSAERSEVWRQRRFGNVTLWNEALGEAGRKELAPEEVAEEPPGVVLFETVRRFKGNGRRSFSSSCRTAPTNSDLTSCCMWRSLARRRR
jgi:hypothetical protein